VAALSITDLTDALKELYPDGMDEQMVYKNHPLLGMLQRRKDFGGRYLHVPIRYGKPQKRSHTFANVQSSSANSKYDAFQVTRVNDYGSGEISGEAADAAKMGDATIFIDAVKAESEGALSSLGDNLGKEAYRGTSGSRGTVGTGTSTPITLANVEDIYYWEVGMSFTANDTDNTTTPRSGTGVVTGINEDTAEITYTGTITALAVGDYLFIAGDEGLAASGLDAWVPSAAPGATVFFGVDRTASTRLSGIRFAGGTYAPEEVFIRAKARGARSSCRPDYWFMNPKDMANYEVALSGQRETGTNTYDMGFEYVRAYGTKIVEDPDCQVGVAWGIDMEAFGWATMGDAPRVINNDSLELLRSATADAYELRVVARHNFYSDAPGLIMRVALPT
jgi:hypothetical protein